MRKYTLIFTGAAIFLCLVLGFILWQKLKTKPGAGAMKIPFAFAEPRAPDFPDNVCDISRYGAVADGKTKNTGVFQKAIADCAQKGGGKVFVPAGKWLTGAIHLKSNINFNLDKNAEIIFSVNPDDYLPAVFTRWEGIELHNYSPFIYANDAENVAITGQGMLNGQGQTWLDWKKKEQLAAEKLYSMAKKGVPAEQRQFVSPDDLLRPSFIQFINSRNILLAGFTVTDSPMWTIHFVYSENAIARGLNVNTHGHNTDGIVIDSSKNILVENSILRTGDDSIAVKSGLDHDGWRVNRPSENIVIKNCDIGDGHSGVAIGSEMSGGVRNVLLQDLKIGGVDQGIRVKSVMGRGGFVENIWADNITIGKAENAAFQIDLDYGAATVASESEKPPVLRNFFVSNLTAKDTRHAVRLKGLKKSPIADANFSNIKANSEKGINLKNCKNINFKKTIISGVKKSPIFNVSDCQNVKY